MQIHELQPPDGSHRQRRRIGRGLGSGRGTTSGKGQKGQKARAGGFHKVGFEGGQMPLQRRLPKVGFRSQSKKYKAEVRLSELALIQGGHVDLLSLKAANVIGHHIRIVSVIDSGEIASSVTVSGIRVTKGAKAKIEAAGGRVEV